MSEEKIVIAVLIARPIGAPISALHKILFFMITSIPVYEKYIFRYNQTSWPGIKKTFLFLSRTAVGRSPGFQLFRTDRLPKSMTDPVTLWSCNAVYSDELRTGFSPVSLFSVKTAPTTSYSIFESLNYMYYTTLSQIQQPLFSRQDVLLPLLYSAMKITAYSPA